MVLASTVILISESHGTHGHILLSNGFETLNNFPLSTGWKIAMSLETESCLVASPTGLMTKSLLKWLASLLYVLGADRTENTSSNSSSVVVFDLFLRKFIYSSLA
jgi:hypothetical protein